MTYCAGPRDVMRMGYSFYDQTDHRHRLIGYVTVTWSQPSHRQEDLMPLQYFQANHFQEEQVWVLWHPVSAWLYYHDHSVTIRRNQYFLLIVQIGSIIKMCSVASTPLSGVSESQFCEIGLINEKSNLSWKTKSLLPKSYKPDWWSHSVQALEPSSLVCPPH